LEYQGLVKHPQEIKTFIFSQIIDILLVFETYFINKNYFRIAGYIIYHTIHPDKKAHGKTALIIRSSIRQQH